MLRECLLPFSFSCLLFPVTWELSFRLISIYEKYSGLPRWLSGKKSACQYRSHRRCGWDPWVRKVPRRRKWQPTPVFLLGESHGQRSLVEYVWSMVSQRVRHNWSNWAHSCIFTPLWKHFLHFTLRLLLYFDSLPISLALSQLILLISTSFLQLLNIETH